MKLVCLYGESHELRELTGWGMYNVKKYLNSEMSDAKINEHLGSGRDMFKV